MKDIYKEYFADWMEGKITETEVKKNIPEKEFLAFQKINASFEIIAELERPLDTTLKNIKTISQKKSTKVSENKPKVIQLYLKWAMSIAAIFVLFFGVKNYLTASKTSIVTNYGEQKSITLIDGSDVILNAKSSIKYNASSWKDKRELLLDGEAYFKVAKGNTFTVHTKNGSVTVLGTQFNVNSSTNYFNVICYEGKVKVVAGNKTNILTPGKGISTTNATQSLFKIETKKPNWIHGESSFNNTPLVFVIAELEKQFHVTFDKTAIDENIKYTGSFNNKKLTLALLTVFKPMHISWKKEGDKIILSKQK